MSTPKPGTVYPIATLRDIFNLPTREQMETCLRELSEAMQQARTVSDAAVAMVAAMGGDSFPRAFEWPEITSWTDDGKGTVTTRYHADETSGPVFQMTTQHPASKEEYE